MCDCLFSLLFLDRFALCPISCSVARGLRVMDCSLCVQFSLTVVAFHLSCCPIDRCVRLRVSVSLIVVACPASPLIVCAVRVSCVPWSLFAFRV